MKCYLCSSENFTLRKGEVRDAPHIKVLECEQCGLVTLDQIDHIKSGFYEESGMHGQDVMPMQVWLNETEPDDRRRFEMLKATILNKKILDFGCGAGGFLSMANSLAKVADGIELESRVREYWHGKLSMYADISATVENYDLITAFHVFEHLHDPRKMLVQLSEKSIAGGRIVIEVPSSDDALLTLFQCEAFQKFTYWSQHLFLFNSSTMKILANQAGLKVIGIQNYQRYPLSNHLHWLSKGKLGGHAQWNFLNNIELERAYANALASIGKSDTIIAHLEKM